MKITKHLYKAFLFPLIFQTTIYADPIKVTVENNSINKGTVYFHAYSNERLFLDSTEMIEGRATLLGNPLAGSQDTILYELTVKSDIGEWATYYFTFTTRDTTHVILNKDGMAFRSGNLYFDQCNNTASGFDKIQDMDQLLRSISSFYNSYKGSDIAFFLLNSISSFPNAIVDSLMHNCQATYLQMDGTDQMRYWPNKFSESYKSKFVVTETEKIKKLRAILVTNVKGDTIMLAHVLDTVEYIYIWETWCKPCVATLKKLEKHIVDGDTVHSSFIILSLDKEASSWSGKDIIKGSLSPFHFHTSDQLLYELTGVQTIPQVIKISSTTFAVETRTLHELIFTRHD